MRKSKNRYFYQIFVSPGDARGAITIERKLDAYKLSRSMYAPIFNSFRVIWTVSAEYRHFYVPQLTFLLCCRRPCDYQTICYMDGKTIQGWRNRSQHLDMYLE